MQSIINDRIQQQKLKKIREVSNENVGKFFEISKVNAENSFLLNKSVTDEYSKRDQNF